ncbi:DUF402 domain-containing protein [Catellatospora tritici]|uniref:DUF402 domain-containing protein n=1 Tax=Catellatospora tritici TaxID=2851566 RepID=UPI001C2D7FF6|nr:DUF402 domain-containing protein [Catellatospora tritici]MBV1848790.1 DUF402 domain-containing protein [Catellatospora tritici]
MRRFAPGDTIVRREIMHGEVWFGYAGICVQDTDDLLVTFLPGGTRFGYPRHGAFPAGQHPYQLQGRQEWHGHGMLALHFPGIDHAVFVFWKGPRRTWNGWYFNLQDAPRRTAIGFDTLDHELDLHWAPGAPRWEWKDEVEFAQTGPVRYPGRMEAIQAEGDRVARLLDAGERWWSDSWADWRPDPRWLPRQLPAGWDDLAPTLP